MNIKNQHNAPNSDAMLHPSLMRRLTQAEKGKPEMEIGNRNLENEGTSTIYCIINLGLKMEKGNGNWKSELGE